jgi:excisionase family DNA binding protein
MTKKAADAKGEPILKLTRVTDGPTGAETGDAWRVDWPNGQGSGGAQRSPRRLMNLQEVADLLRVSPHTVRAWVRQSRLKPVRFCGCRRLLFDTAEIERQIRQSK